MTARASLRGVSTSVLSQLRQALVDGSLRAPLDRASLVGFGIRAQLDAIVGALAGHMSAACLAVLDVALAERATPRPVPELVWTGPEAQSGTARDTAVVLRALFEQARETVILGGYSFSHAHDVLAPLYHVMRDHGVTARFFVHIPQVERGRDARAHLHQQLDAFLAQSWPFGEPRPRIYYDKRALLPGPPYSSLHAKCVVVDGAKAFVSSANFTQRAHEHNIEVGVLIDDSSFAGSLASQWLGLIDAQVVAEYTPSSAAPVQVQPAASEPAPPVTLDGRETLALIARELPEALPLCAKLQVGAHPVPELDFCLRDRRGAIVAEALLHWSDAKIVLAHKPTSREQEAWRVAGYRVLDADEVFAEPEPLLRCLSNGKDA